MMTDIPTGSDIQFVHDLIRPYIHRTPVMRSSLLDEMFGGELFFKCENLQKAGAFKSRGATHAVLTLSEADRRKGVATHSSGNHAQALARAAKRSNIKAFLVMPSNSSKVKVEAVKQYGGEVIFCEPTLEARESTLSEVIQKTGAVEVHPYNDYRIIAGQATAAKELLEDYPELDIILAPVGGGGLLSGTALSAKYFGKHVSVIAVEPEQANDAYKSFVTKTFIPSVHPNTIADGLRTSLGSLTFPLILHYVDNIVTVSEQSILESMKLIWERMKILVETSSSVPLAALLEGKVDIQNKKAGIILSGGNVDLSNLPW